MCLLLFNFPLDVVREEACQTFGVKCAEWLKDDVLQSIYVEDQLPYISMNVANNLFSLGRTSFSWWSSTADYNP